MLSSIEDEESSKNYFLEDSSSLSMSATAVSNVSVEQTTSSVSNDTGLLSSTAIFKKEIEKQSPACYCGKSRNLSNGKPEFQCGKCLKWFHHECLYICIDKCIPFMTCYIFFCRLCNKVESFQRRPTNFSQMCETTIANLMKINEERKKVLFSKDKDIIPFIDKNWDLLTNMPRRIKQTWHNTVHKTLLKEVELFTSHLPDAINPQFRLKNTDLFTIGPSYEGSSRALSIANLKYESNTTGDKGVGRPPGRGPKRRLVNALEGDGNSSKKPKSDLVMPKLPPNGYPTEHPFNKDGFRYILAEPDSHAPFRQEFDESQDWAGKPIPGWLYRKLTPSSVLLAMNDRAPQLKVSEDRLSVTGEKGYCMIRATHSVNFGTWYYEVNITEMPEGAATRIGWSQELGNLQGPCGYDKFSYSWRSRKGTAFHESKGHHYAETGYKQGDVVGCLIHLSEDHENEDKPNHENYLPSTHKDRPLVKFKNYLYFEEKDDLQKSIKQITNLKGSYIAFYKNGKSIGKAFTDIKAGLYFPAASFYRNVTVNFNFGPNFKYSPKDVSFRGIQEAAQESIVQQALADLVYFTDNEGSLRLDTFYYGSSGNPM